MYPAPTGTPAKNPVRKGKSPRGTVRFRPGPPRRAAKARRVWYTYPSMQRSPKDIATRARDLSGPARTRFLDEACAGDPTLRRMVDRLLVLQDSATLDAPSENRRLAPPSDDDDSGSGSHAPPAPFRFESFRAARAEGLPDRVGAYKILGELGSGAMGVVYVAEQRQPRRRVALKVVRPDVLTPSRERRFDLEAEALAKLRHPGIATIYEAGRADLHGSPHPFFAMELVQGEPLDTHARRLDLPDRVALMATVCDAVDHAHKRGILHRDLKPANILVDYEGRARVLDFGVARTIGGDDHGREVVGTIPYMSPEQLAGDPDVDPRADVYALGVILCEILLGRRPHELSGLTIDEALDVVAVPALLDTRAVGPELEAVIARALTPDRELRYASAADMGADLRRYLACEPVVAFGGGRWYRFRKGVRRNPVPSALSGVAVLLLAGGVAGVSWQAAAATRGWHQATLETERAEAALERAEAERRRVYAVNVFMTDMLTSADPEIALGAELTVRELLDNSAATIAQSTMGEPDIESTIRLALANTYIALGELGAAREQAEAMLATARDGLGPEHPMTADAERTLGRVMADTGEFDEAEALIRHAIPVVEKLGDPVEIARVRAELARVMYGQGLQAEALALWERSFAEIAERLGPDHLQTLIMAHNTAMTLKDLGRLPEAEAMAADTLERRERTLGPDHPQTLAALDLYGGILMKSGREADAVPIMRRVVEGRARMLGDDHLATMLSMGNLGATLIRLGQIDEAEPLTRRALEAHRAKLGPEHARTLVLLANLAYVLEERGRLDEAAAIYKETIDIRTRSTGGRDPETWVPMNNLAMLYQDLGRLDEAAALYEQLLALCDETLPPTHYYTAIFRNNYGACLTKLGRHADARAALDASHAVIEATFGTDHERTAKSRARRAELDAAAAGG